LQNEKFIAMKNRFAIYLPILFSVTLILGIFIGNKLIPSSTFTYLFPSNYSLNNKISDIISFVKDEYVDSISKEKLTEDAISGLLQNLDPHSDYIPAKDVKEFAESMQGNFEGIGVQFKVIKDTIVVLKVIPDGPSQIAGLYDGDRIVKVDGKNVANIKIKDAQVMKLLKGKKDTEVTVSIYRKGKKGLKDITITRGEIPTWSIDIAYMPTKTIGYIKLERFSATTGQEFNDALKKLKAQGMKKLIFDLRGNGGGYLDEAVSICDQFLSDEKLIVYTKGFHRKKKEYFSTKEGEFQNEEIAILIDEYSASASEIVSGAMQDNDRATIIGKRSFGKGLVQEQVQLSDGSAIRLTVARYYTPSGRCIQKPYANGTEAYFSEFYMRLLSEGIVEDTLKQTTDTVKYYTSKGKVVYGGGGITPDIIVSSKVDYYTSYYRKLQEKNLIYLFAFNYVDFQRDALKKYGNASNFVNSFVISDNIFNDFIKYAEVNGVPKNDKELVISAPAIRNQLKAYIGRSVYDDEAFYPVLLSVDKVFQKAMEVIGKH